MYLVCERFTVKCERTLIFAYFLRIIRKIVGCVCFFAYYQM